MTRFDEDSLRLVADRAEVTIVTTRPDGTQRRTVIWAVVDDGDILVRSVRGERGHWFQAAIDRPEEVELRVAERRLPVRVVEANDDATIARCSAALEQKYRRSMSLQSMLQPHTLHTTLRLDPR